MKNIKHLQSFLLAVTVLVPFVAATGPAASAQTSGSFMLTVTAKNGGEPPVLHSQDLALTIDHAHGRVTSLAPLGKEPVELLIAIDDGLRGSFNNQLNDLKSFVKDLPENVLVGLGYMQHGEVVMASKGFTADRAALIQSMRTPTGISGVSGSPYFVIGDVCQHWPSKNPQHRRELLAVTDGIERYTGLHYDPMNPYVENAAKIARSNGVLVDSIYFSESSMNDLGLNSGQNYLQQMATETGGFYFNEGMGTPVSIGNYLSGLKKRLANQYAVEFTMPKGKPRKDAPLKVTLEDRSLRAQTADTVELKSAAAGTAAN